MAVLGEQLSPGPLTAAFDVLFWNADTTRMTAALHREMVLTGLQNALTEPGAVRMLGSPVDLGTITADTYVIAGVADHISPWQACYRSARMLGSKDCASSCPRADTSPRWSIPRATRRRPTARKRRRTRPDTLGGVGGNPRRFVVARLLGMVGAARRRAETRAHGARR